MYAERVVAIEIGFPIDPNDPNEDEVTLLTGARIRETEDRINQIENYLEFSAVDTINKQLREDCLSDLWHTNGRVKYFWKPNSDDPLFIDGIGYHFTSR